MRSRWMEIGSQVTTLLILAMVLGLVLGLGIRRGLMLEGRSDLGSRLIPDLVASRPTVSAPPPEGSRSPRTRRVDAFAEVDGQGYRIVVGALDGPPAEGGLWRAVISIDDEVE